MPVQAVADDVARQCADTLGTHRVALVRHSGRADLVLLERLLYFLQVLQQTQVGCELGSGFCDTGERCERLRVDLAGVGLTGDRNHACKAEIIGNALLQLLNLALVAVKQLQKAGLCAVVPCSPKGRFVRRCSSSCWSKYSSYSHRLARLPTVVSCAGW